MAGSRSARPGARAHDRLARLRRERRRAARRLRRLRPRRPARRHGARARDEGAAPPRRGDRHRRPDARPRARRRAVRALPRVRRLPLPGSRVRRRSSRARSSGSRDSFQRLAGLADAPLEPIVPAVEHFGYRNKMEYSFTQTENGAGARLPPRRPLGRGARDRALLPDDRPRQRDPQPYARLGARGAARRLRPGDAGGLPPPPRRARGPQHRPGARAARHRRAASASTASA